MPFQEETSPKNKLLQLQIQNSVLKKQLIKRLKKLKIVSCPQEENRDLKKQKKDYQTQLQGDVILPDPQCT
ncbi:MAG: hypothetical protein O3B09_03665, partial [Proteobacteria bacterium]|nr:hypothetical protein [Pseudomonadota bacterium]